MRRHDAAACGRALEVLFERYGQLVSLSVETEDGRTFATRDRGRSLDEATERKLDVRRALSPEGAGIALTATFAFDRRFERELERAGAVHDAYTQLEKERTRLYAGYLEAFAVLLGITVVATVVSRTVSSAGYDQANQSARQCNPTWSPPATSMFASR